MKLIVPYVGELQSVDRRLTSLADFLGITWEAIPLPKEVTCFAEYLDKVVSEPQSCLVIHPRVIEEWVGQKRVPAELLSLLVPRFPHILVHAPRREPFDADLIAALSCG